MWCTAGSPVKGNSVIERMTGYPEVILTVGASVDDIVRLSEKCRRMARPGNSKRFMVRFMSPLTRARRSG
jgi:hypothetical protein